MHGCGRDGQDGDASRIYARAASSRSTGMLGDCNRGNGPSPIAIDPSLTELDASTFGLDQWSLLYGTFLPPSGPFLSVNEMPSSP